MKVGLANIEKLLRCMSGITRCVSGLPHAKGATAPRQSHDGDKLGTIAGDRNTVPLAVRPSLRDSNTRIMAAPRRSYLAVSSEQRRPQAGTTTRWKKKVYGTGSKIFAKPPPPVCQPMRNQTAVLWPIKGSSQARSELHFQSRANRCPDVRRSAKCDHA